MENRAFSVGRGCPEAFANQSQGGGIRALAHKLEGKVVKHKGRKISAANINIFQLELCAMLWIS